LEDYKILMSPTEAGNAGWVMVAFKPETTGGTSRSVRRT
jgi:hypothetical protein